MAKKRKNVKTFSSFLKNPVDYTLVITILISNKTIILIKTL